MKYFSLSAGIITLIIGLYLFFNPLATLATIGWVLALAIFISGISGLNRYFSTDKQHRNIWSLLQHTISLIFGFLLLTSSTFSLSNAVTLLLSYWLFIVGALRLIAGIKLNQFESGLGRNDIISAIITLILALILFAHPILSAAIIGRLISIIFISIGISSLYLYFKL